MEYNKLPKIPCSVITFVRGADSLSANQIERVGALGLGPLLKMKPVHMRTVLLSFLIRSYNATNDTFELDPVRSFSLMYGDVELLTGLKNDGVAIEPDESITGNNVPEFLTERSTNQGFSIYQMLANIFRRNTDDDIFVMSFVLLALGTVLAPVSNEYIPYSYFALVRDIPRIRRINWNAFTLDFLKANLATMNASTHAKQWPAGNLALLQYCYWEKVRPYESNFFFCSRNPPYMAYWDEDTALKRDHYNIIHGHMKTTLVDDLKKRITIEELQDSSMRTPESRAPTKCSECDENTKKISSLEKKIRKIHADTKYLLRRNLMDDFDDNADASESDSTNRSVQLNSVEDGLDYTFEDDGADPTVAWRVKRSQRKRKLPTKFRSPMKTPKKNGKSSVAKDADTEKENADIEYGKAKGNKSLPKEAVTAQEHAAIESVNSLWALQEDRNAFQIKTDFIVAKDMAGLTHPPDIEDKYLGNEVIDAYTEHVLQPRVQDKRLLCPAHYSWMFSRALLSENDSPPPAQYYLKLLAKEIFDHEKVFLPVNLTIAKHWIVLVMLPKKEKFQILDSLQWNPITYMDHLENVKKGIDYVAKMLPTLPNNVSTWEITPVKNNIPKQTDGNSCGVFAIKYMELWNGTKFEKKFTQRDIPKFRRQMAAELIFLEKNEAVSKEIAEHIMRGAKPKEIAEKILNKAKAKEGAQKTTMNGGKAKKGAQKKAKEGAEETMAPIDVDDSD